MFFSAHSIGTYVCAPLCIVQNGADVVPAEPLDQPGVNGSVLGRELRRRAARLAALPELTTDIAFRFLLFEKL